MQIFRAQKSLLRKSCWYSTQINPIPPQNLIKQDSPNKINLNEAKQVVPEIEEFDRSNKVDFLFWSNFLRFWLTFR